MAFSPPKYWLRKLLFFSFSAMWRPVLRLSSKQLARVEATAVPEITTALPVINQTFHPHSIKTSKQCSPLLYSPLHKGSAAGDAVAAAFTTAYARSVTQSLGDTRALPRQSIPILEHLPTRRAASACVLVTYSPAPSTPDSSHLNLSWWSHKKETPHRLHWLRIGLLN